MATVTPRHQPARATLTSVAKQAKTAFLHGPTVWRSAIVGIEPATFRSESAALTTAPRDPTRWPSNCTGFHGHDVTRRNSSISYISKVTPSAHRQISSQKLRTDCKTPCLAQQHNQSLSPVKELPFQRQVVALPFVTSSIVDYNQIHHK